MNLTPEQQWSALSALYEEADALPADALPAWLKRLEEEQNPLLSQLRRMLEALDAELAQVVEMRYFGGYSEQEIAEHQGVTERTVRRRWEKARAWLYVALGGAAPSP